LKGYLNCCRRLLTSASIISLLTTGSFAQSLTGHIQDENDDPVPFANIFIKELGSGSAADAQGKYYLTMDPGTYTLVISSIGFNTQSFQVIVSDKTIVKNFRLSSSNVELKEVVIKARRRDPAYEIIQHVIDNKARFLTEVTSFRSGVYVRASENVDQKKKPTIEHNEEFNKEGPPVDPIAEERKKEEARLQQINLVEIQVVLNYQFPDQYKEERIAFKSYGRKDGLFLPVFSEVNFNFYHNLVKLKGISEVPVISPFSRTAIVSYKFKLEETLQEDNKVVYKIKVTPRKTGDATCTGYVYINDGIWNIKRLELTLIKGGLKFYDAFTIKQTYKDIDGSLWIPYRQEFEYETQAGSKRFKGNTILLYTDYEKNYSFPPKFFGNEVSVTTKEAYKRDSVYWNKTRSEPLTVDQRKVIAYRDSVQAVHSSKKYLDSLEAKYNKVTLGEILYNGIGFRSEARKSYINLSPLLSLFDFQVIGGLRLGPGGSYYRMFENGRRLYTLGGFNVGLRNSDWQGNMNVWTRYNPYRLGDASIRVGRAFYSINSFNAYLSQLKISNYILHNHVELFHRIELLNGLYVSTELGFSDRHSVAGYDATSILNKVIPKDDPLFFENYQAFISTVKLAYTPKQKYMREPNQKVVLGSKFPTFSLTHKKGWNGILTSDIDFDYLEFSIEQNLTLGTLGTSKYTLMAGKFVNTHDLRYVDLKRFRKSDPYLYSDPLHSFQLLDSSLVSTDLFLEGHYIHHFNGAMINNIPLIKKTKLRTVGGAGFMWIKENNYRYEEIFGGVERIFKLGARRRLRIGVYGVLSQSNFSRPQTGYKISFDIIDTWKREWNY
jgi:hypothetical protein